MSIVTTQTYLVNKIKAIAGVPADSVYPFESMSWTVYPVITITLKSGYGKFITTQQNERHYLFAIRVYQEIVKGNVGAEKAESNLMRLSDLIIDAIDKDIKLGTTNVYSIPPATTTAWVQNQPIRIVEFELDCIDITTT